MRHGSEWRRAAPHRLPVCRQPAGRQPSGPQTVAPALFALHVRYPELRDVGHAVPSFHTVLLPGGLHWQQPAHSSIMPPARPPCKADTTPRIQCLRVACHNPLPSALHRGAAAGLLLVASAGRRWSEPSGCGGARCGARPGPWRPSAPRWGPAARESCRLAAMPSRNAMAARTASGAGKRGREGGGGVAAGGICGVIKWKGCS